MNAPGDHIGRTIAGRFEVLELLGQGGMGKVYKARHVGLEKMVCVKTLKPQLLEDATIAGRFKREAMAASRLNHPNAIQVLDFGEDESGALYLAMEFVSGKDLRKTLLEEFPLGEERICHIVAQVLAALGEAHAQNVIHRDLKPENIMIEQRRGEPDFVKVLDFGIAKIQDPDVPGLTRADVICGTPLYMSPEQATGMGLDARADLYAIGVILYQLATGTLPFDGANSMEILMKHVSELPVPPRARRPEVAISPEMEDLILRALSKEPSERPQTAEAFRHELLAIGGALRKQRETAVADAERAATAHRLERAKRIETRQAEQRAAFAASGDLTNAAVERALPKRKRGLLVGGLVGASAVVAAAAFVFLTNGDSDPSVAPGTLPPPVASEKPAEKVTPEPRAKADLVDTKEESASPGDLKQADATKASPEDTQAVPPETRPAEPTVDAKTVRKSRPSDATGPAPETAKQQPVAVRPGDTAKARGFVDEADLLSEEGEYARAIRMYEQAIQADPAFGQAYKGLIRAGTASGDAAAQRKGLVGYLKVAPNAPDAPGFRAMLARLQ